MGRNTKEDIFPCDPNKTEKREMDRTKRDRNREKKKQGDREGERNNKEISESESAHAVKFRTNC